MESHRFGRLLAASMLAGGMSAAWFAAQPAFASGATVSHINVHGANAAGIILDFGNPATDTNFSLVPPVPVIPFAIPGSCPFDATGQFLMTGGNALLHSTSNNNGDWGGGTAEGPAILSWSSSATTYTGRLTTWGGSGGNGTGQFETGETFTFNGTSNAPLPQSLTVQIHWHATGSASRNIGAISSSFTCS
jgi:hypothetical protein